MPTAQDVLNIAASQLGEHENPMGSNNIKYNTWYYGHPVSGSDYAWCAVFVMWCFNQLNSWPLLHTQSAYVPTMYAEMKAAGMAVPSGEPGDIVCFQFDSGLLDHVGIVERRLGPGTYQTIEGNTGDAVQRHQRSGEMYFCRPAYSQPTPPQPPRKEDDMAMYDQYGTEAFFGDCWDEDFTYWLHTNGTSVNVQFHLLEHSSNIERHSAGQSVSKHQLHNITDIVMPTPMAPDNKPVTGSFTLRCTSDQPIHWTLREKAR